MAPEMKNVTSAVIMYDLPMTLWSVEVSQLRMPWGPWCS